jgi:uncharacterized damage-inducible protein DinB
METLQYPIGKFDWKGPISAETRRAAMQSIETLPARLAAAVAGLDERQLATPYRPGGWTVRQVVHHVADSHLNAFTRFKLGLTEDSPTIKPYNEKLWSTLADSSLPVDVSLRLIEALHTRWVAVLHAMSDADFARTIVHPESGKNSLDRFAHLYGWHSNHHLAHITTLRERERW